MKQSSLIKIVRYLELNEIFGSVENNTFEVIN